MLETPVCVDCGHQKREHGTENDLTGGGTKREVCLECTGWFDDGSGKIIKPARHRYKKEAADGK